MVVDRVTGYIRAEQTPNQGTDAAIKVIQNWSLLFGYPLLVISDSGGGFRKLSLKNERKSMSDTSIVRHTTPSQTLCLKEPWDHSNTASKNHPNTFQNLTSKK